LVDLSTSEIDWDRVILMPTDERDVPVDHPRSNEGMMRALLSPLGEGRCGFVSLRRAGMPPHVAAAAAAADLRELGPLDLLISGMGDDAHVASLFPSDTVWHDAGEALVLAAAPRSLEPRISLGPAALKAAREVALLIAGPAKLAALDGAMAVRDEREAPVRLLLRGGRTLQVFASRDP
nr:6-phosphogluconolactonase [Hyphomonas sp.]